MSSTCATYHTCHIISQSLATAYEVKGRINQVSLWWSQPIYTIGLPDCFKAAVLKHLISVKYVFSFIFLEFKVLKRDYRQEIGGEERALSATWYPLLLIDSISLNTDDLPVSTYTDTAMAYLNMRL